MKKRYIFIVVILIVAVFLISNYLKKSDKNNNEADNYKVIIGNQEISLICKIDTDCTIINKEMGYRSCWPGACEQADYSLNKYIAVNKESFKIYRESELKFRPSNEECGPMPGCPTAIINIDFDAKCVNERCKKISR